uniref:Snurportin-1 n=1 Tax=Culicoides sonorensis TaxID=179676 RepID=A0A336LV04_CULSO
MTTRTAEMYKNSLRAEMMQIERRHRLLEQQRINRDKNMDKHRKVIKALRQFQQKLKPGTGYRKGYRNVLQMSEWMHDRPDDLENWYVVLCPKGIRCLVVAEGGRTEAIGKFGNLILSFSSMLPGGRNASNKDTTIIDAFFDKEEGTFYAIDVLAYSSQDFMNCDCEFRFYWLNSKIQEDNLDSPKLNKFPIKCVPYASFQDPLAVDSVLGKYPAFPNNNPKLDGLLFYHKESLYNSGRTPLVLWLFPFMVPEVLGVRSVHDQYMSQKPNYYQGYKKYIEDFDAKNEKKALLKKQKQEEYKNKNKGKSDQGKMEVQECECENGDPNEATIESKEEIEVDDVRETIEQQMYLLESGIADSVEKMD